MKKMIAWLVIVFSVIGFSSAGAEEYLNLTQSKGIIIIIISVIVIPLAILLAGLTVFIRRKNK